MRHQTLAALTTFCLAAFAGALDAATFTPIAINTQNANPRGYWEFLPTAYAANPNKNFPIVIFLHGLGEGGDGTVGTALNKVLANELAKNLNKPTDSIRALLDQNEVIVLCPQSPTNTWWSSGLIRPFLDYALTNYRVDHRRIYLTGLSSGSQGVHSFMNSDSNADQLTAAVACAHRGVINAGAPAELVHVLPFWILTHRDDFSAHPDDTVNLMAGTLIDSSPTDLMATYPSTSNPPTTSYTANFSPLTGWSWVSGVDSTDGVNPKLTILSGSGHNSWNQTYNSVAMWTWFLGQQKPDVTITSPLAGQIIPAGQNVQLTANASDKDGVPLTGVQVLWSSSLDDELGAGSTLSVSGLRVGVHAISCSVVDSKFRGNVANVFVSIPSSSPFTSRFDFGSSAAGFLTTDSGWNNVTDQRAGQAGSKVENAIDTEGNATGLRLEITHSFTGINANGAISPLSYPETAQNDSIYVQTGTSAVRVSGLNPTQTYQFTFFASRAGSGDRTTFYKINGTSVALNATNNTSATVSLNDVQPDASGAIDLHVWNGPSATYGYLGVLTISTAGPPANPLISWRALQGLATDGSEDLEAPAGDGVPNLLKFAFNMAPTAGGILTPNRTTLPEGGASGLPLVKTNASNHLTITFVRRTASSGSGLVYEVEASGNLTQPWENLPITATPDPINAEWERVTVTDPSPAPSGRFLRVRVTSP